MTNLLVKYFVKDSTDVKNPKVRQAYGVFSGIVGIICNVILFVCKFFAGIITGSVSISADAFNNLSDAGSSVITLLGFKLAGKPADPEHPFGHGRIEYIAGLIVSAAIIVMSVELFRGSVVKILHPQTMEFSLVSVIILIGSIMMKLWMSMFNRALGNKIDSAAMKATATDSLSDCIATTVALASLLICSFTGLNVDGLAGAVVAIFVFMAGVGAGKETLYPLLGQMPEPAFIQELREIVLEDSHIIGIHDLIVHDYGPGRVFVSLHAEIPQSMDIMEAHDAIDLAEKRINEKMGCETSIHMDPIATEDKRVNELKQMVAEVLKEIDPSIKMHDFRITQGPCHTNLIFDVVVPFRYQYTDEELIGMVASLVTARRRDCYTVINVDKAYIQ